MKSSLWRYFRRTLLQVLDVSTEDSAPKTASHCPLAFPRRMKRGHSVLLSMTLFLKMDSLAATNQYAAKCPNWPRNYANATPLPPQVGLDWNQCQKTFNLILSFKYVMLSFSKGNCSSCSTVFSVLKKRVRALGCIVLLLFTGTCFNTLSLCCRETAVTVVTASVHDAVPTKYCDHAWGRQVRKQNYTQSYENNQSFLNSVLKCWILFFSFFSSRGPERDCVCVCCL